MPWERYMCYDKLREYSKFLVKERKIEIFFLIMESFFFSLFLWAILIEIHAIITLWLLAFLLLILFSVKGLISNRRLQNELLSIEKNNALNKTYRLSFLPSKVVLLQVPKIRHYRPPSGYYGIKVIDGHKNKYYYFFEEPLRYDSDSINRVREKFKQELHIQCYENTSIIKTVENDLHFIHIRHGALCK